MPYDDLVPYVREILTKLSIFGLTFTTVIMMSCVENPHNLADLTVRSRKILELQSCEYVYRDVVYLGQLEKFLGIITSKETKVLFSINLRVKAGIDLSQKFEITPVQAASGNSGPAIRIRLPIAKILSVDADETTIHQYFVYEYGLMAEEKINLLDVQDELSKAKERAKNDAIKRNILNTAWNNSGNILRNLFHLAGFKTVLIEALPDTAPTEAKQ